MQREVGPARQGGPNRGSQVSNNQHELRRAQECQAPRPGEQQRQILRPAFFHLRPGAVHAGADGVAAVAEENLAPGGLHQARHGNVFEQVAGDLCVAADLVVSFARDQQILPVGGGDG